MDLPSLEVANRPAGLRDAVPPKCCCMSYGPTSSRGRNHPAGPREAVPPYGYSNKQIRSRLGGGSEEFGDAA